MKKKSEEFYQVFARKFRPEDFEGIVGQEQTTGILRNAIRGGRIPQAFLFAGPRGTGKTSTARVLAKALNCVKGPTDSPCNQCPICDEINRCISLDVLEIDGASNRRIDEVRDLRENVKFKPAQARFKIYIIDEVHMLTDEAFNALLKTLEEPPAHVKFIFATTEPHKVPLTILSRCQRFNFKRIPTEVIVKKLKEIAKAEKLNPEPNALFLMARASDGSLRDAETLLDQLSALSKGEITEEDVLFALGLASEEIYFDLLAALQEKDAKRILTLSKNLYEEGKDMVQFGRGLHELMRNLLLLTLGQDTEAFVEMAPESKKKLGQFKAVFSREELLLVLSLLQNLQTELRRALASPRLLLETALLKLLHLEGMRSVEELVESQSRAGTQRSSAAKPARPAPTTQKLSDIDVGAGSPRLNQRGVEEHGGPAMPSGGRNDEVSSSKNQFSLNDIERVWPQVVDAVKAKEMSTGMFLAEAQPVEVTADVVVLGLPEEFQFHKEMLERPEKRKLIEQAFAPFFGSALQLQFVTTQILKSETHAEQKQPAKLPEIVTQAMNIFQGSKVVRSE